MSRPSPAEKAAREKRREERSQIRTATLAREEQIHLRVKELAGSVVKLRSEPPTLPEIYDKLERAFVLAMET